MTYADIEGRIAVACFGVVANRASGVVLVGDARVWQEGENVKIPARLEVILMLTGRMRHRCCDTVLVRRRNSA